MHCGPCTYIAQVENFVLDFEGELKMQMRLWEFWEDGVL